MRLGRVTGKVWATAKDAQLSAVKLALMEVVDEHGRATGKLFVAADTIGCREGDLVFWVSGGEAVRAFPDKNIPSDVTIVGLVDQLDVRPL
ncbi:MAG: EutN/CcmL family microcompartment protein [candidate division KSB1 bacterium]|nr:EutN/CcmL family microcompartment protein [candidate division KSB1 bacterium]MDZ7346944.1 EutN/CcmL family microcompartment protein [candidate division KSB1 bacterium]